MAHLVSFRQARSLPHAIFRDDAVVYEGLTDLTVAGRRVWRYTPLVNSDDKVVQTQLILNLLIRAMVTDQSAVAIEAVSSDRGTTFRVRVGEKDVGKVLGRGGRVARSIRIVLTAISKELGATFFLNVEGREESVTDAHEDY